MDGGSAGFAWSKNRPYHGLTASSCSVCDQAQIPSGGIGQIIKTAIKSPFLLLLYFAQALVFCGGGIGLGV